MLEDVDKVMDANAAMLVFIEFPHSISEVSEIQLAAQSFQLHLHSFEVISTS